MPRMLCFFLLFISFFANSQVNYYAQSVDRKCDSLAKIYGPLPLEVKDIFKNTIVAHQQSLYAFNEIDRNVKFEKYLLDVYRKVNPASLYTPQVYLFKSSYPNAFTDFNGDIFFHWAFIADLEDEAGLAYTMGHEVTHHTAAHLYLSYLENFKIGTTNRDAIIQNYQFEQRQEYYADSVGFALGARAGYKWESGLSDFYEFLSLDTIMNYLHKKTNIYNADGKLVNDVYYNDQSDTLFTTHPPTNSRIQKWKAWGNNSLSNENRFLVDEAIFRELQEYCRVQTLQRYLKEQNLRLGIIKAFKYYMLDPDNKKFKYYFLEFLRRYMATYPSSGNAPFLSDIFNLEDDKDILDNLRWVFRNENDLQSAKNGVAKFLEKRQATYADLINKLCSEYSNEYAEFYLSAALYNANNDSLKQYFLDTYLSFENVQFKDFALAYKNDELVYKFRDFKNHFVIYSGTNFLVKNKNNYSHPTDGRESKFEKKIDKKLDPFIKSRLELTDVQMLNNDVLLQQGMYEGFSTIAESWLNKGQGGGDQSGGSGLKMGQNSTGTLSPDLWTFLYANKISEISYVKVYSIENNNVSYLQNYLAYRKAITTFGLNADKPTRHTYFVYLYSLNYKDYSVKEKSVDVKAKLTPELLMTEIYLLLQ